MSGSEKMHPPHYSALVSSFYAPEIDKLDMKYQVMARTEPHMTIIKKQM